MSTTSPRERMELALFQMTDGRPERVRQFLDALDAYLEEREKEKEQQAALRSLAEGETKSDTLTEG